MKNRWLVYLLIVAACTPAMLLRDYTPHNELRYLSIVDDALRQGNFFAFFNNGAPYADKPPLYFWLVMLLKQLCGGYSIYALSLLSLVPALVTAEIMNRWTRREFSPSEQSQVTLMLMSTGFFVGSAVVLRMDMLMTMFITAALYEFWRMWRDGTTPRREWMLGFWTFMAVFSKGAIGILVPLLAVTVFLAMKKQLGRWGRYYGWRAWCIMLVLSALWFVGVYFDGGSDYLHNLLFNQTVNRAVNSFAHKAPFYYYGYAFWYSVAPWSLIVAAALVVGWRNGLLHSDLHKFLLVIFGVTIGMLSCISSKIEIYLLPAFPALIYLTAIFVSRLGNNRWIKAAALIPLILFVLMFPASFFVESLIPYELWAPVWVFTAVLALFAAWGIRCVVRGAVLSGVAKAAIGMFVSLFLVSFSIGSMHLGVHDLCRAALHEASQHPIRGYTYFDIRAGANLDVFLGEKARSVTLEEIDSAAPTILFFKLRDLQRKADLRERIGHYPRVEIGEYGYVRIESDSTCNVLDSQCIDGHVHCK